MLKEDRLLSVGIDIGTTTTHLVVTSLSFGKKSSAKSINDLCVTDKHVLFESAVYETPLAADGSIDAARVAELIGQAYKEAAQQANLDMTSVHTGAVIITGESARTRNAAEVLLEIAKFAGEFVVESAGPSLESILCARGSGAQALSKEDGRRILSLDVGGGTSNFALVEQGEITATAAISIGGRAIKFVDKKIASMSKTAALLSSSIGLTLTEGMGMVDCHAELSALANLMAQIIFDISSAGQALSDKIDIWLTPALTLEQRPELVLISGGVAALMSEPDHDLDQYLDFGVYLACALDQKFRQHSLNFALASKAIRATVLGAGMHTLQLTGSTIDFAQDSLPLRNTPLLKIDAFDPDNLVAKIKRALALKQLDWSKQPVVLALTGIDGQQLQYDRIKHLASQLALAQKELDGVGPLVVVVDHDIAMALGLLLKRSLPDKRIISVDGIVVHDGDYLDIGKPIPSIHSDGLNPTCTGALPVVVKTLIFYKN